MIAEEPASEREKRWLNTATRLYKKMRYVDALVLVEAILMDRPTSKVAQDLLWQLRESG